MKITTRFILSFLAMSVVPLAIVGFAGLRAMDRIGTLAVSGSREGFKKLGESAIHQKAQDVAYQLELYLEAHPELLTLPLAELEANAKLGFIAVQPVGKTGYTAVHDDHGINHFHSNKAVVGTDLHNLQAKYPAFWSILEHSLAGTPTSGYYDWPEADGAVRAKYMVIAPVGKTFLRVAATTYIDEFSQPAQEAEIKIKADYQQVLRYLLVVLVAVAVLGYVLAVQLAWGIARPILAIKDTAVRVSAGDLTLTAPVTSGDEVGVLAQAFNQMTGQLRSLYERYRGLFDGVPVGLYRTTPSGQFMDINLALVQMLGYPDRDTMLTGEVASAYKNLEDRVAWKTLMEGAGVVRDFQFQARRYDGSIIWLENTGRAVKDAQGRVLYYEGSLEDITERKQTTEELQKYREHLEDLVAERTAALQESEQRLADIISLLPDATLVIDREGKVIAWNRAMEELTGVEAKVMLGKGNYEYAIPFYGERRPILIDLMLLPREEFDAKYVHIQKHGQVLVGEAYVPHLRGGGVYLLGTASVLRDPQGSVAGAIEIIRDITENKRAEEALRKSNQREQERRHLSDTLREVAKIVSGTLDQQKVLDLILGQLEGVVTCHHATVSLLAGDELTVVARRDKTGSVPEHITFAADEYFLNSDALRSGQPLLVPDVRLDPRWLLTDKTTTTNSFINAPLLVKNRPIGLLGVGREDGLAYTEEDAQTIFAFASQVAVALEQARLHEYEMAQIERELDIARQIQTSLLPAEAPNICGLDIAGFSQPAQHVGGDFFSYFVFGQEHIGIAVGDVSGKGMQSALMMSLSVGLLTSEVRPELAPAALLSALNVKLQPHTRRNNINTAATYLTLERKDNSWQLAIANAGGVAPLLVHCRDRLTELINVGGLPLGTLAEARYRQQALTLTQDNVLVLCSDGIVEAMNTQREMYGFERLMACVANAPCQAASEIQEWILSDVRAFAGGTEMHDDLTLIVIVIGDGKDNV